MNFDISSAVNHNHKNDLQICFRQYFPFNNIVNVTINLIWTIPLNVVMYISSECSNV